MSLKLYNTQILHLVRLSNMATCRYELKINLNWHCRSSFDILIIITIQNGLGVLYRETGTKRLLIPYFVMRMER
jgi:hypothetical protein